MRSVEEQLAMISAAATIPEPVRIAISESLGLRCAERVEGTQPFPGFDQAAIDGFAVRSVDVRHAVEALSSFDSDEGEDSYDDEYSRAGGSRSGGARAEGTRDTDTEAPAIIDFPIVGDISAGSQRPVRVQPRQAVRVEAGAPLPNLADAVLPLDWVEVHGRRIRPLYAVNSGEFVHRTGSDVQAGDVLVEQGAIIGAAQVGLLAAAGRSKVLVYPKPRLSVMSFGQELVDIDRELAAGIIFDVNSYALAAAGREAGAEVNRIGVIQGEPRKLKDIVEGQLMRSEVLVIAGAVGGEAADRLCDVLDELGDMQISRVAMHPASILGFGLLGAKQIPTFLLPANPSAALVAFEVMVRPLLLLMRGQRQPMRRVVQARTIAAIESMPARRGFIRGQLMRDRETMDYLVDPLGASAPGEPLHLLGSHGQANCLIVVPDETEYVQPGQVVDVMFLSNQN